jgi:glycosyltransferase involved in cell wall biosynthesis
MIYLDWIVGIALALIWLSRVMDAWRGAAALADISRPEWDRFPDQKANRVAIVVPARNEEAAIGEALRRLLALDGSNHQIMVIDDRSTDKTPEIIDQIAHGTPDKITAIHIRELPPGWMGKAHAMWTAARLANSDWILFTDADVMFRNDALRRAIAYAEAEHADHLVMLPRILMKHWGEKMMVAFFHLLFVFGHRPWKVSDPKAKDHLGVGAFNLVRRHVYEAVGTYEALRFDIVDDMKLGKVIKTAGFRQRVVFGDDLIAIRWARGAMGVVNNLTKNFFAVVSFQTWRALGSCVALIFLNIVPFIGMLFARGSSRVPYGIALLSMFFLYLGMRRHVEIHPWYFFLHPLSSVLFVYTMIRSTFLTLWHGGVEWRGTTYPLEELRKRLV